ncbi:hypothetical protein DC20_20600 [Rufibacter tibetensis]|uniref:N-acetyltransferase domain-containing protein n=1 Tax=Rufibacter tibetensis TaxID=512763 RepID=A0A0P0CXT2_9BACT|nr:hypothetical protein DC20_20600 [Rufibacter tibetensis]
MEIRKISAAQTWPLRQQVMWPEKPLTFVQLPDDKAGFHFGLFVNQELVSVISLFIEVNHAQFRKFCTLVPFQGQGYGQKLLQHVLDFAFTHQVSSIWCHARTSACAFYLKAGMQVQGEKFIRSGIAYVRMEKHFYK